MSDVNPSVPTVGAPADGVAAVQSTTANELRPPPHRPFGRGAVDKFTDVVGTPLTKVSPMLGNAYNSGVQLRTLLGNGYFVLPVVSGFLGALAVRQTHGLAIPPTLWLTLVLTVIGIFDAFSGLIATLVFAVGVAAGGHLFSSHLVTGPPGTQGMLYAFTGLLTMAFLWFIGPRLPRMIRLLGFNSIKDKVQRRYVILADFFVVTLLMILILGSLPIFVPIFTGASKEGLTQVVLQNHIVIIKWVVGISTFIKVGLDEIVHAKFQLLPRTVGRQRGVFGRWLMRLVAAAIALALVWELLGTVWQWPVVWVLLVSLEGLSALGERFLKPRHVYRYVPRNLFRIVTLLLFDEYAAHELTSRTVSGVDLLAWLVLLLVIVVAIYAILDGPDDLEEGDRPATWWTRLVGVVVVIALFVISQDIWSVPATPYADPAAVATNSSGYLFIADSGNGRLIEVGPAGGRARIGGDLDNPSGVAPAVGATTPSVYVSDSGANEVYEVAMKPSADLVSISRFGHVAYADAPSAQTIIGSGFLDPTGLATDAEGRLFVADTGHDRIVEIEPTGQQITFAGGLATPVALATDAFGHVFVTLTGTGEVLRYFVGPNGLPKGAPVVVARGLDDPQGVAADAQGNLYVADSGANKVIEYLTNRKTHDVAGTFVDPRGLAVDGQGHLYVADAGAGLVILSEPVYPFRTVHVGPTDLTTAAAYDPDGSSWVVSESAGTLEHVTSSGVTTVATGLDQPDGVCFSALGRLYIAEAGNGTIDQVNPVTGRLTLIAHGLAGVGVLTPNPYGGMYALLPGAGKLYYVSAQGTTQLLLRHLTDPTSVVQDAYDFLDLTLGTGHGHHGQLWRVTTHGRALVLAHVFGEPTSLAADFRGDLFLVDRSDNTVYEDRGLDGYQIVWQGHSAATDPVAVVSNLKGDLTIFTESPGVTIHLTQSTTDYQI